MITLYNTLSKSIDEIKPLSDDQVGLYSCGPTVYDHVHIGNLRAFIYADILRRVLQMDGYKTHHVMNFTDVDDKTIRRSHDQYPQLDPKKALLALTEDYAKIFIEDIEAVGNDVTQVTFIKATDSIQAMQQLITDLYAAGFAYIADDGVYFSIAKYKASGKVYGQLSDITTSSTSESRIQNDEYDKESAHDFALWKKQKQGEPAWDFELDGQKLLGRPGWHIECSAMSVAALGQPFDIHTGGVDLIFPHHENEIAQSTAGVTNPVFANFFVHNEHMLIDGKKMSKSLDNFFTLKDIIKKGYSPMDFRLLILQAHYRSQAHFSWENLDAARNTLINFYRWADLQFQTFTSHKLRDAYNVTLETIKNEMYDDLKTPNALALFSTMINQVDELGPDTQAVHDVLVVIDNLFGLKLLQRQNIESSQVAQLDQRQHARDNKDYSRSDELRKDLEEQGIGILDTKFGAIWYRL